MNNIQLTMLYKSLYPIQEIGSCQQY